MVTTRRRGLLKACPEACPRARVDQFSVATKAHRQKRDGSQSRRTVVTRAQHPRGTAAPVRCTSPLHQSAAPVRCTSPLHQPAAPVRQISRGRKPCQQASPAKASCHTQSIAQYPVLAPSVVTHADHFEVTMPLVASSSRRHLASVVTRMRRVMLRACEVTTWCATPPSPRGAQARRTLS